jgi:hypothetical protein
MVRKRMEVLRHKEEAERERIMVSLWLIIERRIAEIEKDHKVQSCREQIGGKNCCHGWKTAIEI